MSTSIVEAAFLKAVKENPCNNTRDARLAFEIAWESRGAEIERLEHMVTHHDIALGVASEAKSKAVPEGVLLHLSELQLEYRHDDNSAGDILCPACSAYELMNWKNGVLQNEVSEFVHDSDCPIIWAKAMLAAAPQP